MPMILKVSMLLCEVLRADRRFSGANDKTSAVFCAVVDIVIKVRYKLYDSQWNASRPFVTKMIGQSRFEIF